LSELTAHLAIVKSDEEIPHSRYFGKAAAATKAFTPWCYVVNSFLHDDEHHIHGFHEESTNDCTIGTRAEHAEAMGCIANPAAAIALAGC
jgi:hypothetical protein